MKLPIHHTSPADDPQEEEERGEADRRRQND
jgi:hypothetical protein